MKQKILSTLFFIALFSILTLTPVIAQKDNQDEEPLPEKEGIYKVKNRPDLKLKVFVHTPQINRGRPKPSPTATPAPNCNLLDPDSAAVSGTFGVYLPPTVSYYLNINSFPSSVGSQNAVTIAENSFNVWRSAIGNRVTISRAGNTTLYRARFDGRNIISWGNAPSGTLGVTYLWSYNNGQIAEVDTIMNQAYFWKWSNPSTWGGQVCAYTQAFDAQNILTHELGHWIGVDDDYEPAFENNTMYGYGSMEETKKDTLTDGDVTAAMSVYQ